MAQLQIVNSPRTLRKMRRPKHTFNIRFRPYQIVPFAVAPVLAGETLKNANWKGRLVSDPLATNMMSALIPWWVQTFVFYVKLRDLLIDSDIEAMMLEGVPMPQNDAANAYSFHGDATRIDWTKRAYERVVAEYFRDEGEAVSASVIDGIPAAAAIGYGDNFFENIALDTTLVPDNNDLQNPRDPSVMDKYAEQYERMRAMRLVEMSFEEWLGTYGVKVADPVEKNKPELIRYTSNWTYPTNTVEPSTGIPSTAVVHSIDESADKDRFFTEPGILISVVLAKAKIYPLNQTSSGISMLDDAYGWLPALLRDELHTSLAKFDTGTGPFKNITTDYWLDRRDLFVHGDHFRNWSPAAAGANYVSLPTNGGDRKYIDLAAVRSFFKDADGTAPDANYLYLDGIINFNIAGHPTTGTDMT